MNENNDAVGNEDQKPSKPRTRSPGYPAISLPDALEKAKVIWEHEKKNPAPMSVLASHFDINPKSSSFLVAISAMKKYGLLEEIEGGRERLLKLTQTALNIILSEEEESQERIGLIKQAALTPKIHAQLWRHYNGDLPSDANLRRYLIVELEFNDTAVESFIKDFKTTIEFAKLTSSDKIAIPETSADTEESPLELDQRKAILKSRSSRFSELFSSMMNEWPSLAPGPAVVREFNFPLPAGVATLKVPFPLSEEDFDNLMKTMLAFKHGLVKKQEPVVIECAEGWQDKASALAESGLEINLTNFDYSFDIDDAKEFSVHHEFDLRLDPNKKLALFRKRLKC